MPQNQTTVSPFTGQSLTGNGVGCARLEDQGDAKLGLHLCAATAFDVQVAAATTTSRQHTLNKGSRARARAPRGRSRRRAMCLWFQTAQGSGLINEAFRSGKKVQHSSLSVCQSGWRR